MTDREKNFIADLTALSAKYGLKIYGCGCCGSPAVEEMQEGENVPEAGYTCEGDAAEELIWVSPETDERMRGYGRQVIRREGDAAPMQPTEP